MYKSKCGYFYKVIGNKKIRISTEEYKSMNGGGIESNGQLNKNNFSQKIQQVNTHSRRRKNEETGFELQDLNKKKNILLEPKIMIQRGLRNEPYIFFGYNQNTGKYKYVFCNDIRFFNTKNSKIIGDHNNGFYGALTTYKKKVRCYRLKDDGINIVELSHDGIKEITLPTLSRLYIFLLKKRINNQDYFMNRLFYYLYRVIYYKITKKNKNNSNSVRVLKKDINFNFLNGYFDEKQFIGQFIPN